MHETINWFYMYFGKSFDARNCSLNRPALEKYTVVNRALSLKDATSSTIYELWIFNNFVESDICF